MDVDDSSRDWNRLSDVAPPARDQGEKEDVAIIQNIFLLIFLFAFLYKSLTQHIH